MLGSVWLLIFELHFGCHFSFKGTVCSRISYTTAHNDTKFVGLQLIKKCYLALLLLFMAIKINVNLHSNYHQKVISVLHFPVLSKFCQMALIYSMLKLYFTILYITWTSLLPPHIFIVKRSFENMA